MKLADYMLQLDRVHSVEFQDIFGNVASITVYILSILNKKTINDIYIHILYVGGII